MTDEKLKRTDGTNVASFAEDVMKRIREKRPTDDFWADAMRETLAAYLTCVWSEHDDYSPEQTLVDVAKRLNPNPSPDGILRLRPVPIKLLGICSDETLRSVEASLYWGLSGLGYWSNEYRTGIYYTPTPSSVSVKHDSPIDVDEDTLRKVFCKPSGAFEADDVFNDDGWDNSVFDE